MRRLSRSDCLVGILVILTVLRLSAATGADRRPVAVPDPLSGETPVYRQLPQPLPDVGKPFGDSRFGTQFTRVTRQPGTRHEYARFDPFNKDQSMILLLAPAQGKFQVWRTRSMPYDAEANSVRSVDLEEPRWDPEDRDLLWGTQGFRILTVHVSSGRTTTIKDFAADSKISPLIRSEADLYRITMKDEGESSWDKRYWAFALQGSKDDYRFRYLFTWDRKTDQVLGLYKVSREEKEIDWVGMSPRGNWVLISADANNKGRLAGVQIGDKALTRFHRIDFAGAHGDVGMDAAGREVLVTQNPRTDHIDMLPLDLKTMPILESAGSYEGTNRTPLVRLFYASDSPVGFNCGVHISCNAPGWCVISTYAEPNARQQNWLDRSILLVRLDSRKPQAFYLAKVHNTTKAYWEETQASISNDGSKVVWAANWDQNAGKEQCFLMQLDVPPGWRAIK